MKYYCLKDTGGDTGTQIHRDTERKCSHTKTPNDSLLYSCLCQPPIRNSVLNLKVTRIRYYAKNERPWDPQP